MLKTTHRYEQTAARLVVEGFPDLSAGQEGDTIGILSGWTLQLIGAPELEGTRDHLEALMNAVMPYARHQLSGVHRRFGGDDSFVAIEPNGDRHQLELRSSRAGVEPLQLNIDDAELSDLVRCLDRLRLDQRSLVLGDSGGSSADAPRSGGAHPCAATVRTRRNGSHPSDAPNGRILLIPCRNNGPLT